MRVLFDISHPAHVHFYRYMWEEFGRRGWAVAIASREKDVTNVLLETLHVPHTSVSRAAKTRFGLGVELITRNWSLWRLAKGFRPDLILTRSPSGAQVASLLGVPSVFDTDNGLSAGIHYRLAAPFATIITTPDCFPSELGSKQIRYPSYKPLAFLHPDRFEPNPQMRRHLGVNEDQDYFIIRLVAMQASHDYHEKGVTVDLLNETLEILGTRGPVFITSESGVPSGLSHFALPTEPSEFHDVLAGARLCFGDSGSVAQEAAVLGVPSVFVSTFAGRTAPIQQLEDVYGLVSSFQPSQDRAILDAVRAYLDLSPDAVKQRHRKLLADKVDLTAWYVDLVERLVARRIGSA